ncbi:MAG: hypothetical protein WC161_01250 [Methanocorpusculum sp.]
MKKQTSNVWAGIAVLISVLLLIGFAAPAAAVDTGTQTSPPLLPEEFYGTATLDGAAVSTGSVITAKIDDLVVGTINVTTAGKYGDVGTFGERLMVTYSIEGGMITFWLGDLFASQSVVYEPGKTVDLPLTFRSDAPQLTVELLTVPNEVYLDTDDSLSANVGISVKNRGLSEYNDQYDITGKLFGINFTLPVEDTISAGATVKYNITVKIGPSVASGTQRTGDFAYSIFLRGSPQTGSQTSEVGSDAWTGTRSETSNVIAATTLTVVYPTYENVSATDFTKDYLKITGIPDGQSVSKFTIPLRFDPSIAVYVAGSLPSWITVDASTGLLTIKGIDPVQSGSEIVIPLQFKSVSYSGKSCNLSNEGGAISLENAAGVKYKSGITQGSFSQRAFTPKVNPSLWASSSAMSGTPISVYITVSNPADVSVENVTLTLTDSSGNPLWSQANVNFGMYQSYSYTASVTLSQSTTLNLTALPYDGEATAALRPVEIISYKLEITPKNKADWKEWYGYDYGGTEKSDGYNKTVLYNNYPWLGTYFTTNASGYVSVNIDFKGKESEIFGTSPYQKYNLSYYSYSGDWNSIYWYSYLPAGKVGEYPYTITLNRNGVSTSVDGVLTVREVMVDIKVLESKSFSSSVTTGDVPFALYSRSDSDKSTRSVEIALSSGSSGRTLQGLEYLIGYPHGCPEQVTSPLLAALFVKEYYGEKGMLSDSLNTTIRNNAKTVINDYFSSVNGSNRQQSNGGWAWGRYSTPSFGYTTLPMYGIAVLMNDVKNDPDFWSSVSGDLKFNEVNLNKSAEWILATQDTNGGWSSSYVYYDSDYYDKVTQTLFAVQALSTSYDYLDAGTKDKVNASLIKAAAYLDTRNDVSDKGKAKMASSYLLIEKVLPGTVNQTTVTPLIDSVLTPSLSSWEAYDLGQAAFAVGLCDEIYGTNYVNDQNVNYIITGITDEYGSGGRWYSTYTTGIAIRGLNSLSSKDIPLSGSKTFTVNVKDNGGNVVATWDVTFDATKTSERIQLTADELTALYGASEGDFQGNVSIAKSPDLPLIVAVTSKEQVPKSTAYTSTGDYDAIPYEHIDPITNNFSLVVSPPTGIIEGDDKEVMFTAVNRVVDPSSPGTAADQGVMILEVITSADKLAVFDVAAYSNNSAVSGTHAAYYIDSTGAAQYIEHMYNESTGSLYVYVGSDDGDAVSIPANGEQNIFVPLKFATAGTAMIESRLYPMYDDEMMALGDANVTVLGYGNLNLTAVDEDDKPLTVMFAVEGQSPLNGTTYSGKLLEGDHNVTITYGASAMHLVQTVSNGEITEYKARFISSAPVSVMSDGDVQLLAPVINETISNVSSDRWNAVNPAKYVLNISVVGDDANSTINVEMPAVYWQGKYGAINSSNLGSLVFDTIVCLANASGTWTSMPYSISADNKTMTIGNINPTTHSELSITLNGRLAGDVNGDGYADIDDACDVAWSAIRLITLSDNDKFYGDVDGSGEPDIDDACDIAWKGIRLTDEYYNPLI